jgi:hypothetical protein
MAALPPVTRNVPSEHATIAAAIAAANDGDTILVAAGTYSGEQLTINKAITIQGAGMNLTTYTHTGASFSVVMSKSGAILRDMKILKPHTNTDSIISVQRESRDIDATGCKLINVQTGSSTATKLARGVAINGISNVTVQGCVFSETTASYTLGLASVKGITVSGCTIPASMYGSVGIFPTTATAYGSPLADPSTSGIDLSINTWTGNAMSPTGGVINVQPNSYASYKLAGASGSAAITLPVDFHYAYLQQVRNTAGTDLGLQNGSISHAEFLGNATIYGMLQASAGAGNRVVLFGRDLRNNQVFFNPTFDNVENRVYANASNIPCIPAGQRVLTASGWRPVEELRNGDIVVTDTGASVPAKICSSTIITSSISAPINIPASLFGKSGPPVRLSPGHAVRMRKGVWEFPGRLLRSLPGVTQDAPGEKVTYYHVILPNYLRDNLVLEGGAVAESFGAPFAKAHGLNGAKIYTYNKHLGGYTRMAPGEVKKA